MAVDRLPAAPEVATQTLALLERDTCRLADLTAFIATDQAIAAGLLRIANSAFFGLNGRIANLAQAVTRLGFARVRDLVLALSVWQAFDSDPSRRYALWLHSALVAGVAKQLVERMGRDGSEAFTGGVVHDAGKLLLGQRLGASYWRLVDDCEARESTLVAAEQKEFGCHHGIVGGWLFQLWRLPPSLVDVASQHHDPLALGHRLDDVRLIGIADRLVDATDPTRGIIDDGVFREIALVAPGLVSEEQWPELYGSVVREQQEIGRVFTAPGGMVA
jgi:HD-like signal output (HDOD) protein